MMRPHDDEVRRTVDIELDGPRLALLAAVIVVVLVTVFAAGRLTAPANGGLASKLDGGIADAAPVHADVGESASIFDRDDAAIAREPGRQVVAESSRGGEFEVLLGVVPGRSAADAMREAAARAKVPAMVVRERGGGYRVSAGPFSSRADADRAASRLRTELGHGVTVLEKRQP